MWSARLLSDVQHDYICFCSITEFIGEVLEFTSGVTYEVNVIRESQGSTTD
ncbi:hypothetical protein DPMN_089226 [Dreissena polymorpha]|uniref:Uncharacterized protein n=1 Tax=Dreissena polymorpha TaxID=45954 RepID=A0A9D4KWJ2_DREPO|nr:hypothetical protein DPMN_089226 [Dreissena polymorpha]